MINLKNIIQSGIIVLSNKLFNKRIPLNVMLSVTNRCNGNCQYCRIAKRFQKELTTEEIFSLIEQLDELGTQRLGLWGGEPLLREDLSQIINYAKSKGMFLTLDTNGYLVPSRLEVVKKVDHLIIAFEGKQTAHDILRGEGSYKKVIKALDCTKESIPTWTITVLTKYNLDSIDYIMRMAQKYNFLTTFQTLHHNKMLGGDYRKLIPRNEEYKAVLTKLIKYKKRGAPIASSLDYLKYLWLWPDYKRSTFKTKFKQLNCLAGKLFCNVDTNGDVYPCSLLVGITEAKNYLEAGFKEAFLSLKNSGCNSCNASCYVEYNYLYNMNFFVIMDWLNSFYKTKKLVGSKEEIEC